MVACIQMCRLPAFANPVAACRSASALLNRCIPIPAPYTGRQTFDAFRPFRIVRCIAQVADEPTVVKVKRPATAYCMYVKDNYTHVQNAMSSGEPGGNVFTEIGKQWAGLQDEEKDAYKQRAAAAMAEHTKLYPAPEKAAKVPKVRKVRVPKAKGKMSGYNLYVVRNLSKQDSEISGTERFKALAASWKAATQAEKDDYAVQAAQLWEAQQSASA